MVDTFSWYAPAIDPRFSYRGQQVAETRERACRCIGYPRQTSGKSGRIEPACLGAPLGNIADVMRGLSGVENVLPAEDEAVLHLALAQSILKYCEKV